MNIISRFFNFIEARRYKPRFRLVRTLYVNFRLLPFMQAIRLPMFVCGRMHCWLLNGKVVLDVDKIRPGMIKFGTIDPFSIDNGSGFLSLPTEKSRLIFKGPCHIDVNSKIKILASGIVTIGKYARIRSGVRIICNGGEISIGDYSGIAFESVVMNSNFHSVIDLEKGIVAPQTKPIIIGNRCWIGNRSTIMGGAMIKDDTIVASGSLVNKDYVDVPSEYQVLAGAPAKVISANKKRVFSPKLESEISLFYNNHPEAETFHVDGQKDTLEDLESEF